MRNIRKSLRKSRKCARAAVAAVACAVIGIAVPAALGGARASAYAEWEPPAQGSSVIYNPVTGGLDAFQVTTAGAVRYAAYQTGHGWQPWQSLGGAFQGTVSAVSTTYPVKVVNVFATARDGSLQENSYTTAAKWTGWRNLGGKLASSPAALFVSWTDSFLVFGTSPGNGLHVKAWLPQGGWQGWRPLGAYARGTPSPLLDYRADNAYVEVYVTGTDGIVKQSVLAGSRWTSLRSVGAAGVTGDPSAILDYSMGGKPEVYAASGGQLTVRSWTPGGGWKQAALGGAVKGSPAAIFDGLTGNVEVYYQGSGGTLMQYAKTPAGWSGTRGLGGSQQLQSGPVPFISNLAPPAMDVFAICNGKLAELSWSTQTRTWSWWKVIG
jgi:hypothetical protein